LLDGAERKHFREMRAVHGGSMPAPRTASRTASSSADDGWTSTGTASTQPSATRMPPSMLAAALQMHVPSTPSVTAANPSCLPAGIVIFVSSSPGATAVM
jgi:hypothetical protein